MNNWDKPRFLSVEFSGDKPDSMNFWPGLQMAFVAQLLALLERPGWISFLAVFSG
ncbi:MAG: hypothetical protein KKE51_17630 [Gammaproteobacteria bacterium]|nr:hypothetical protein [Gammaproteobacteria bacterium]MBU1601435.1 hypothetical protein [Gammaproteobacteria bacterium]MBU2433630.1 hypothetical protein [Gammaproteobacteria bacterium]MBU2449832.1 hypothetical protein [Gammaproteobacteria bacterium]